MKNSRHEIQSSYKVRYLYECGITSNVPSLTAENGGKLVDLPSVEEADLKGKRVLMRVDVNVPFDSNGNVRDHQRIIQILPTINYILYSGAEQLILMSHHGRPHGKFDITQSLRGVAKYFRKNLAYDLYFVEDCIVNRLPQRKLLLLENLRFHMDEEENGEEFARHLSEYADVYVNDAFGSYQPHSSVVSVPKFLPSYAGFLFQQEIQALNLQGIKRPLVFLLGGDKASTKLPLIKKLANEADHILIGGVLPFYFMAAQGSPIGRSKFNKDYVSFAKELLGQKNIVLPQDFITAAEPSEDGLTHERKMNEIGDDEMALDIGPQTLAEYKRILSGAGTVIWNGPMGLYEIDRFAKNTDELARHIASLDATTIAGGGDSITVINKLGIYKDLDYVSTGGGATLKYLENGTLPAIEALKGQKVKVWSK